MDGSSFARRESPVHTAADFFADSIFCHYLVPFSVSLAFSIVMTRMGIRMICTRMPGSALVTAPARKRERSNAVCCKPAKAAQQCWNVHWAEHGSDLRDLSRQKRQDQCNGKIQRRVGKLSDLHRRTCIVPGHRHAVSPISVSSWRICSIASSMMAEDFWLTPAT